MWDQLLNIEHNFRSGSPHHATPQPLVSGQEKHHYRDIAPIKIPDNRAFELAKLEYQARGFPSDPATCRAICKNAIAFVRIFDEEKASD